MTVRYFAVGYDCGAYGAGRFDESQCNTTSGSNSSSGGMLADTGYDIIIPLALGAALVIAAAIRLIKYLVRQK